MRSMKSHFRAGEQSESLTSQSFDYICPEQKMANISPRCESGIINQSVVQQSVALTLHG